MGIGCLAQWCCRVLPTARRYTSTSGTTTTRVERGYLISILTARSPDMQKFTDWGGDGMSMDELGNVFMSNKQGGKPGF